MNLNRPSSENTTDRYEQPSRQYQLNEIHGNHDDRNRFLKPLKIPTFNGDKQKFEDFWALFRGLVDESTGASKFENGKAVTMPHRERLGSHPRSRSHRSRIRGGQRDIKHEVWWCATASVSLRGSIRTNAIHYEVTIFTPWRGLLTLLEFRW